MLLLGNIMSLIGCTIMVIVGLIKDRKKTLAVQIAQMSFMTLSNFALGGITGVITNLISIARNLVCFKGWFTKPVKYGFLIVMIILAYIFNNAGLLGWLPIIAVAAFTLAMDTKSNLVLKVVIGSTCILWAIYDFALHNYVAFGFDIATIISSCIGMYRIISSERIEAK